MAHGVHLTLQISVTSFLLYLSCLLFYLPLVNFSPVVNASHNYIVHTGRIQNNLHILKSADKCPRFYLQSPLTAARRLLFKGKTRGWESWGHMSGILPTTSYSPEMNKWDTGAWNQAQWRTGRNQGAENRGRGKSSWMAPNTSFHSAPRTLEVRYWYPRQKTAETNWRN